MDFHSIQRCFSLISAKMALPFLQRWFCLLFIDGFLFSTEMAPSHSCVWFYTDEQYASAFHLSFIIFIVSYRYAIICSIDFVARVTIHLSSFSGPLPLLMYPSTINVWSLCILNSVSTVSICLWSCFWAWMSLLELLSSVVVLLVDVFSICLC